MSASGSWWWGTGSGGAPAEFDKLLESCTSSNLPSSTPPPITDSLTLSDFIRSTAVSASHAIKSLQRRLNHSNPNVQLLVISVIDICVKNGGDTFLKEIGSREFGEDCARIISSPTSNREVREKLKREFQNWALAFEAVPFLSSSELVSNYRRLKSMGIDFPPKDPSATAAMVDSMSAPEWRDSDVCERCRTLFSFTNRKHHCRNCGGVFDGQCSSKKRILPHYGVAESVRVCDGCDRNLAAGITKTARSGFGSGRRNSFSGESSHLVLSHSSSLNPNAPHRSATVHAAKSPRVGHRYTTSASVPRKTSALSREEADLERAIALSLQESESSQPAATLSRSAPHSTPHPPRPHEVPSRPPLNSIQHEPDDPDLAAAIAASLRDVPYLNAQPSAPMPISPSESSASHPPKPPLPPDFSSEQINALLIFSAEVETAGRTGQLVSSNVDLRKMHAQAQQVRPYFNRGVENADRKTQLLKEMNDKLSEAVRLYDRLLGEQIMYHTQSTLQPNPQPSLSPTYGGQAPYNTAYPHPAPPPESHLQQFPHPTQPLPQLPGSSPYAPSNHPAQHPDQTTTAGHPYNTNPHYHAASNISQQKHDINLSYPRQIPIHNSHLGTDQHPNNYQSSPLPSDINLQSLRSSIPQSHFQQSLVQVTTNVLTPSLTQEQIQIVSPGLSAMEIPLQTGAGPLPYYDNANKESVQTSLASATQPTDLSSNPNSQGFDYYPYQSSQPQVPVGGINHTLGHDPSAQTNSTGPQTFYAPEPQRRIMSMDPSQTMQAPSANEYSSSMGNGVASTEVINRDHQQTISQDFSARQPTDPNPKQSDLNQDVGHSLPIFPSAPKTTIGSGMPTFPSVPTGQTGWLNGSSNHELQPNRQEEVAPLIEL